MYNIKHVPLFDIDVIIKYYTEKDGVDVKYICTTSTNTVESVADIFYRETFHPIFGNKYFGIYYCSIRDSPYIFNADEVEDLMFAMIEHDGVYYYSRYRHDFVDIPNTNMFIDGGRDYVRSGGDPIKIPQIFKIKDGNFLKI